MRHGGRLAVGLIVCLAIAAVSAFMFIDQFADDAKGVDDLGEARPSEIELLPIPEAASSVSAGFGTLEPGNGVIDGRVYDFPSGFSRSEVAEWYEQEDLAGEAWGQWTWCTADEAAEGVHYFWVAPEIDELLSLEVGREDRDESPAEGNVVVRMELRELSSLADEDRPTC